MFSFYQTHIQHKIGKDIFANFVLSVKQLKQIHFSTLLIAFLVATPLISITIESLAPNNETFTHIKQTVLADYVINTLLLALGVSLLVVCIGVPLAWLIAACNFWGKSTEGNVNFALEQIAKHRGSNMKLLVQVEQYPNITK